MKFKEVRLDATVAVVHKHGIGSCRGELRASPAGVRYETSNANDRFAVALADMTAFEMDYLAGILRIRTSEGRTYNFSHPENDADRLFAFHKAVEAARGQVLN
jgi:hypothetical protein